ncbi:MAG: periplasmic heavy metal sensor [Candidatus Aminicenantes bacterium]|nr:periplasmic heavy metal sensor [Candidatus Aminicenantes bacterium]
MKTKHVSLALAFLVLLSGVAFGQGQGQGQGGGQNRQRVRENLATLRLLRLTQALDLTEEQAAKFFPTINRIEKDKIKIQRDMTADIQKLRQLVAEPAPNEAEIGVRIKSIKDAQRLARQKDDELESHLESSLTTVQKAKYVLFQIEFYRMLEQSLERGRMMRNNSPLAPIKK